MKYVLTLVLLCLINLNGESGLKVVRLRTDHIQCIRSVLIPLIVIRQFWRLITNENTCKRLINEMIWIIFKLILHLKNVTLSWNDYSLPIMYVYDIYALCKSCFLCWNSVISLLSSVVILQNWRKLRF